ncbi:metal ABC transporter permease [Pyrococcus yayanosii]|uniref:ABC-type manganese/zinc transport system, permease component n=1 Tax=Pyrococcus yayanosii (strain CH1 / JCM 16557) TaxID=529709 RepID=F8AGA4_PYRYC|nr:metal ABC transporter permease [Pyrococcus yayanosii]AEH23940.1 ABC-type manganese/zinc transport system, permease component [Pyrococcus yayanosii CH1]
MIPEYLFRALLASVMVGTLLGMLSPLINIKGAAFLTHATFHSLLFGAVLGMILGLIFGNLSLIFWVSLPIAIMVVIAVAELEMRGYSADTAVGAVAGLVAGLTVLGFGLLYKVMASRPYFALSESIVTYLTGEIFLVTLEDLWMLVLGGIIIFGLMLLFYRDFVYLSFDPEGMESCGGHVRLYLILLYILVGATGGLIVKTVGLITLQVVAVLPGAIAMSLAKSVRELMGISLAITLSVQLASVLLGYVLDMPPSGIATIFLGMLYGGLMVRRRLQ